MTNRALCVVVQELGPTEFTWTLLRRQSSGGLTQFVAASSSRFPDYDEALDAGFVALQGFCPIPLTLRPPLPREAPLSAFNWTGAG